MKSNVPISTAQISRPEWTPGGRVATVDLTVDGFINQERVSVSGMKYVIASEQEKWVSWMTARVCVSERSQRRLSDSLISPSRSLSLLRTVLVLMSDSKMKIELENQG